MGKKEKGLRSTNWQLENSRGNIKHNRKKVVDNTAITMCGATLQITSSLHKLYNCLTPMLYI